MTMMFEKHFLNKLKEIKYYCSKHDSNCNNCIYKRNNCLLLDLSKKLSLTVPKNWNLEKVKEMLDS